MFTVSIPFFFIFNICLKDYEYNNLDIKNLTINIELNKWLKLLHLTFLNLVKLFIK